MKWKLTIVELCALVAAFTMSACGSGSSVSGSKAVDLKPNVEQAIANVSARGDDWMDGINKVIQVDEAPPPGVNWAIVDCPGHVVMFNTTFDRPVEHMEQLLVHEAFEIQHGCEDNDPVANAMANCYASGRSYEACLAETRRLL